MWKIKVRDEEEGKMRWRGRKEEEEGGGREEVTIYTAVLVVAVLN